MLDQKGSLLKETVFNIQRYSIHDGPGIRTTVFLKGCPLRCVWCSNPESQDFKLGKEYLESTGITKIVRRKMSVDEVLKQIIEDQIYYRKSGGGVTFSGGEPLAQLEFLEEILNKCYNLNIHTVIETAGLVPWSSFERILGLVDLFLYDIKHMDNEIHKKITGVSNERIIKNLCSLAASGAVFDIRIPLIPKLNATRENLVAMGEFISRLNPGPQKVHILPFHQYGSVKYRQLKRTYDLDGWKGLIGKEDDPNGEIQLAKRILENYRLRVQIGG